MAKKAKNKNFIKIKTYIMNKYKNKFIYNVFNGALEGINELGEGFYITISNNDIVLSVTPNALYLLDEFIELCNDTIGANPICKYDLVYFDIPMTTIEWDIVNPKLRIDTILDGNCFIDNPEIINFTNLLEEDKQLIRKKN